MTMRRIDLQPLEPFTSDFIDRTGLQSRRP